MPRSSLSGLGLRFAIPALLLAAGVAAVLVTLQLAEMQQRTRSSLDRYAGLVGQLTLESLHDSMLERDTQQLQHQLEQLAELPSVFEVRVVDTQGVVRFSSDPDTNGQQLSRQEPGCQVCHHGEPKGLEQFGRAVRFTEPGGRRIFRTIQPVVADEECLACHKVEQGEVLAIVINDLDDDALTGELREGAYRTAMAVALGILVALAGLGLLGRKLVLGRLLDLRSLLDQLRSGARSLPVHRTTRDEIDDLTQAVQALTEDLDDRLEIERSTQALDRVLARHEGPVVLVDQNGWIAGCNPAGGHLLLPDGGSLVSLDRRQLEPYPAELYEEALEMGWSLAPEDPDSPAIVALHNRQEELVAMLEVWPERSGPPDSDDEPPADPSAEVPVPTDDPEWAVCASALCSSLHSGVGRGVLVLDRRLATARALAATLGEATVRGDVDRVRIDLRHLTSLSLWDLRRQFPDVNWTDILDPPQIVLGHRYHVRALLHRLAATAARQSGSGGCVVLFTQGHEATGTVFLGAWSSRPGGQELLDPPMRAPLATTIAHAMGGTVEVDPAYDLATVLRLSNTLLTCGSVGTLYLASLEAAPAR